MKKIKCSYCGKEIDRTNEGKLNFLQKKEEPLWYGRYVRGECVDVICSTCIKDPEKKEKYRNKPA